MADISLPAMRTASARRAVRHERSSCSSWQGQYCPDISHRRVPRRHLPSLPSCCHHWCSTSLHAAI